MNLCGKCINNVVTAVDYEPFIGNLVTESECEFWAHVDLRKTKEELEEAVMAIKVAGEYVT
jgi:hypothetical protein